MTSEARAVREVLAITLILSACSLLYELLIAQTLSLLAGSTVVWYSLTVGTFLGAMGLGAVLYDKRRTRSGWSALYRVELVLSAVGASAVVAIQLAHSMYLFNWAFPGEPSVFPFFAVSLIMILLVGLLSGIELPLLIELGNEVASDRKITNRVLGWDYIGALAAGVLFPIVLVPNFELVVIGFGTAIVNLSVGAWILWRFVRHDARIWSRAAATFAFGSVLLLAVSQGNTIQQYFLKRYYFHIDAADRQSLFGPLSDFPDVYRAFSPYQKIDLVHDLTGYDSDVIIDAFSTKFVNDRSLPTNRALFLNGDLQLTSNYEELYHEWFAHVPIILQGRVPERVLVMGAGDGLLLRELIKHDAIRSIVHVDLDRTLVHMARVDPVLTALNRHALEDPRIETRFGDAYQFLRRSDKTFDAIYSDFPMPRDYNLSKLYSREFFHFVRQHLADDGFAVLDAPGQDYLPGPDENGNLQLIPGGEWDLYYNTIRSAGFESLVPFHIGIEGDNPAAFEILDNWPGTPSFDGVPDPGAWRRQWIGDFIQDHALSLRQSFILMWNDDRSPRARQYRDLGIELDVLNEKRFGLSFPPPFPLSSAIDFSKVNSILRPTLPAESVWSIRRPW